MNFGVFWVIVQTPCPPTSGHAVTHPVVLNMSSSRSRKCFFLFLLLSVQSQSDIKFFLCAFTAFSILSFFYVMAKMHFLESAHSAPSRKKKRRRKRKEIGFGTESSMRFLPQEEEEEKKVCFHFYMFVQLKFRVSKKKILPLHFAVSTTQSLKLEKTLYPPFLKDIHIQLPSSFFFSIPHARTKTTSRRVVVGTYCSSTT